MARTRIENNYINIKKIIGNNSLLAVVKADAYGHGVIPISKKLESLGVNFFAVFTIDEAIELRKNGINADIIIFERLSRESYKLAIKYNIIVNVSWFSDLEIFKFIFSRTFILTKYFAIFSFFKKFLFVIIQQ